MMFSIKFQIISVAQNRQYRLENDNTLKNYKQRISQVTDTLIFEFGFFAYLQNRRKMHWIRTIFEIYSKHCSEKFVQFMQRSRLRSLKTCGYNTIDELQ